MDMGWLAGPTINPEEERRFACARNSRILRGIGMPFLENASHSTLSGCPDASETARPGNAEGGSTESCTVDVALLPPVGPVGGLPIVSALSGATTKSGRPP